MAHRLPSQTGWSLNLICAEYRKLLTWLLHLLQIDFRIRALPRERRGFTNSLTLDLFVNSSPRFSRTHKPLPIFLQDKTPTFHILGDFSLQVAFLTHSHFAHKVSSKGFQG